MPSYPFYQVDAFATRAFEGNQACVIPMDDFLPDETLLAIAAENNVSETAYLVPATRPLPPRMFWLPMAALRAGQSPSTR